jgi:hypothetical protein
MKAKSFFSGASLVAASLLAGCETIPPGAERGPDRTMAYTVSIEASDPDVRIEANGQSIGTAPVKLKIFGDPDGTFHDFGAYEYVIQAFPTKTNQFVQTRIFRTGRMFTPEDYIPRQIYFDMNQRPPAIVPRYDPYPPPYYHYPPPYYYWGPSFYYGPRVYVRPRLHVHPHR